MIEEASSLVLNSIAPLALRVRFEFDDGARYVWVNRVQIQQVIVNLIRNAFEAMADQESREVTLATRSLDDATIEIALADNGPGIPGDIAGRLFEPFISNKPDGMGLGLPISRSIVEAHDGQLTVQPNPGGGTIFRFTLPSAGEATFWDDDDAVLRSLERLLRSANFEPVTFDHPDAFLTAAKTFKTGCVLLDVRLPGMSGLDVQAQLLKMRTDLAVIVVTGQGDVQTAVRAMKTGATDFLEKPYSDHALLGSIEAVFARENRSDHELDISDAARRIATLSPREREVLDGLLAGRPNKLIAFDLGISVRTVEVHRARMMERLRTASARRGHPPEGDGEAERAATRRWTKGLGRDRAAPDRNGPAAVKRFAGTVFQGAPVQDLDRSLARQGNDAPVLQIGDGTTHGLDRNREIFGDVIARHRQFDLPPSLRSASVKRKQERADLLQRGDAAKDQELVLGPIERLKCDLAEFAGELRVTLREKFDPSAGIACKHRLFGDRFDHLLSLGVGDKEEIPRQHQIDDLPPPVRADRAAPDRADDNVVPVACWP
jgi:two-component system response regulator FixJ